MRLSLRVLLLLALAAAGCPMAAVAERTPLRFQSDWYPQTEHGGHYQALVKGFYAEAGLDVEILPGGPGAMPYLRTATGEADMTMARSDDIMVQVANGGLPLVMVAAQMQRDPQAILVHEDSPVRDFPDLAGRQIMATAAAAWVPYLKARYRIEFDLIPLNFGLGNFLADRNFIQQCLVTNEPYFVALKGVRARTLLLADSGYRPYRVLVASRRFLATHPDAVRAFIAASLRGWDDFLNGDPSPAFERIGALAGERMPVELMRWSHSEMRRLRLVEGDADRGERNGLITRTRMQEQLDLLRSLKLVPESLGLDDVARFDLLPESLQADAAPSARP